MAAVGGLAASAEPAPAPVEAELAQSLSLSIDLSARTLKVIRGGEVVNSYPVAVGQPSYPTPQGHFSIAHVVWNPRWVPPDSEWAKDEEEAAPGDPDNPMGRVKIFFREPSFYIHGTHEVDSLGRAESHGCVRMRNGDAIEVAQMVMRAGGSARPPGWFKRTLNRMRSTREVYLSNPVPLVIKA